MSSLRLPYPGRSYLASNHYFVSHRVLLAGTAELGISILPANQARHDLVMTEIVMQVEGDVMPCEMTDAIQGLWEDPGVRQVYARRNELQINDSAS